jgi:fucose 4-O-acetylase-like acetyltransferase
MPSLYLPTSNRLVPPSTTVSASNKFSEQTRVEWVDYCKGLGIFLVVVGHVLTGLQQSAILSDSAWYQLNERWLYSFHMPLFFLLSGLFVRRSTRRSVAGFISNKMAVLAYPYFVWSIIQGFFQTLHYASHRLTLIDILKIPYVPIDQFWFLYTLFIMMVIYRMLLTISMSDVAFFFLSTVCFVAEIAQFNIIRWNVAHDVASFLIYFAAGTVIARGSILVRFAELKNAWLFLISAGGYAAVAIGIIAPGQHEAALSPARALAGITATVALAIFLSRSARFSFIKLWGKLSLEIYVVHVLASAAIRVALQRIFGLTDPMVHFIIGVVAGVYVPILFTYTCQRMGIFNVFTLSGSRLRPVANNFLGNRSILTDSDQSLRNSRPTSTES